MNALMRTEFLAFTNDFLHTVCHTGTW